MDLLSGSGGFTYFYFMYDTLIHAGLALGGGLLIWLGAWNIEKDDEQERETSSTHYVVKMLIGFLAAIIGILLLLRDFINLF